MREPIRRIVLEQDHDCDCCQCPKMMGEVAFRDPETNATGCSLDCVQSAAEAIADQREVNAFLMGFDLDLIGGVA